MLPMLISNRYILLNFNAFSCEKRTDKWHVFPTQIHLQRVGNVTDQDKSEADDRQSCSKTFHDNSRRMHEIALTQLNPCYNHSVCYKLQ